MELLWIALFAVLWIGIFGLVAACEALAPTAVEKTLVAATGSPSMNLTSKGGAR